MQMDPNGGSLLAPLARAYQPQKRQTHTVDGRHPFGWNDASPVNAEERFPWLPRLAGRASTMRFSLKNQIFPGFGLFLWVRI